MEHPVALLGTIVVICGLLIEFVAFAGIAFYPVRRALPVQSPIQLQSVGCATFFVGVLVLFVGQLLG